MVETSVLLRHAEAARAAGRRMVARGERPMYRLELAHGGPNVEFRVVELPWLAGTATARRDVVATARGLVAAWLGCHPDAFDLATD
jgi:hypothetical protein